MQNFVAFAWLLIYTFYACMHSLQALPPPAAAALMDATAMASLARDPFSPNWKAVARAQQCAADTRSAAAVALQDAAATGRHGKRLPKYLDLNTVCNKLRRRRDSTGCHISTQRGHVVSNIVCALKHIFAIEITAE
jgi:hypothetical protein